MSEMVKTAIKQGKTSLGIEFGSTRIKAMLVDENNTPIAMGTHDWENRLENNIWTYSLEDIWKGLQDCYGKLKAQVEEKYDLPLSNIGAIGFSAMMHGYMAFDKNDELLVPFRTWRNTITEEACKKLIPVLNFNIPHRWSIAHLYQAILNGEEHVKDVTYFTTLAGYIHWKLSGEKVLGIGDASGMFPIDSETCDFNARMIEQFNELISDKGFGWRLQDIMPKVLVSGEKAGVLTEAGVKLLDPTGILKAGIPMCPPEGDAGTGMVATNSVAVRTGNVSAGTSIFAMVVLEEELSRVYEEIDMVTTPDGNPVAMVHCNNCTSDLDAWVNLFSQLVVCINKNIPKRELYDKLYDIVLEADKDCGGLLSYNYFSGESITGFEEGRPLFVRMPDAKFTLANFMRNLLYSSLATLKIGLDILMKGENVKVDTIMGHGGLFKTPVVGQTIMAAAMNAPVSVMDTASEGGAWGIAILASYMKVLMDDCDGKEKQGLGAYLNEKVFAGQAGSRIEPDAADVAGFEAFVARYKKGLPTERAAVDHIKWG